MSQNAVVDYKRVYNRTSLSFIMTSHPGDPYDDWSLKYFQAIDIGGKYNLNPISSNTYLAPFTRDNQLTPDEKSTMIEEYLNGQDFARQIISYWYNRQPDGSMDLSRVQKRGQYNATDELYAKYVTAKRGADTVMMDFGDSLIKNSYIVVFDVNKIAKTIFQSTAMLVWNGNVDAYIYQVEFSKELETEIFKNCWIDSSYNFTEEEKAQRRANYDAIRFKVKKVLVTSRYIETDKNILMINAMSDMSAAMDKNFQKPVYYGTGETEYQDFMDRMYRQGMEAVELKRPDLKVKTPVYSVHPVMAKIGKKEGLRRNQQFGIYDIVMNEKTGKPEPKRIATIQAAKVAKNQVNANGTFHETGMMSKFGIMAKRGKIEPGMFIEQERTKSASLYIDFVKQKSEFSMFAIGIRNQNFITGSGFTGALALDLFVLKNYIYYHTDSYLWDEPVVLKNYGFGMRLGYSFGFNVFSPNFKIEPFLTGGMGVSTHGGYDYNYYSGEVSYPSGVEVTYSYGSYFVFNVHYPFQVYLK